MGMHGASTFAKVAVSGPSLGSGWELGDLLLHNSGDYLRYQFPRLVKEKLHDLGSFQL